MAVFMAEWMAMLKVLYFTPDLPFERYGRYGRNGARYRQRFSWRILKRQLQAMTAGMTDSDLHDGLSSLVSAFSAAV